MPVWETAISMPNSIGTVAILFGTQFALIEGSYRKVQEKATVLGSVGYAGWPQVLVKVTDGKRGG